MYTNHNSEIFTGSLTEITYYKIGFNNIRTEMAFRASKII